MSSPASNWRLCLFWFHFVFMTNSFSLIDSAKATKQIVILRGIIEKYEMQDFFSYEDDKECGNDGKVHSWCQEKKAEQPANIKAPAVYKCSCLCQYKFRTFLSEEQRCLNISNLENLQAFGFGPGHYLFDVSPPDLCKSGNLKTKKCNGCQIDTVQYFTKNRWKNITAIGWSINSEYLSWPAMSNDTDGRILKIQLKNCRTNETCGWGKSNETFFFKSKSNCSIVSNEPTSTNTVVPTPTLTSIMISTVQTSVITKSMLRVSSTVSCVASSTCVNIGPGPYNPKPTEHKNKKQSDKVDLMIGVSVGAVVACIAVLVGIAVAYIVCKRRKQNSRLRPPGSAVKLPPDSADNPVYGRNQSEIISLPHRQEQDDKHEGSDYATVDDAKPAIYQSLVKENVRDSVYTPLNKETDGDYNHLKHPKYNPPQSKSDKLYNVLQRPNKDLQPGSHINDKQPEASEPVYNVLEDPNANHQPQDNEPVYNVLEDPNQVPRDEPVYNVLEDPDADYDNSPIEDQCSPVPGQDNLAYSSTIDFKRPQSLSSPNSLILEGPEGSFPDSTYQPLSIRTPGNHDVYQSLSTA